MTIEDQLKAYIRDIYGQEVTDNTLLIEEGIVDSMGVGDLVTFMTETFEIEIEMDDMTIENLGSVAAISRLVQSKQ